MRKFIWTFKVEVDEDAVADGLDFADIDMKTALLRAFPLVHGDTFEVEMMLSPSPEAIREVQGYPLPDAHGTKGCTEKLDWDSEREFCKSCGHSREF